jgi:hypothetical protein
MTVRFERLPFDIFTNFLQVLDRYRGKFLRCVSNAISLQINNILYQECKSPKFRFETVGKDRLVQEGFDSLELIRVCELE